MHISVDQLCNLIEKLVFAEEKVLTLKLFVESGGISAAVFGGNSKGKAERRMAVEQQILAHFPFANSYANAKDLLVY